jgi:hypothetical protein
MSDEDGEVRIHSTEVMESVANVAGRVGAHIAEHPYRQSTWVPGQIETIDLPSPTRLDQQLGFPAHSVIVDNPTTQWLFVQSAQRYAAPGLMGAVWQIPKAAAKAEAQWRAPMPMVQPAIGITTQATITFCEAWLMPVEGIIVTPAGSTVAAPGAPAGAKATQAGEYLWVEGRSAWYPAAGTPHPYHTSAAVTEVIIPQDLVSISHPAAGSTASLTITDPLTVNQAGITITGMTAALANATPASAGQLNAVVVTGSLGGAYTSEPLCVPAVAFTIDRLVYRGQNMIGGNGVAINTAENFTVAFSIAGIANLFQSINVYYHFGA